jgi:hypothetical protein
MGFDALQHILLLNPSIPGWSRKLPIESGSFSPCAVWAGSGC